MTADEVTDEAVWERMGLLMPFHDCGRQMSPGGSEGLGPIVVCVPCSFVAAVDPEHGRHPICRACWEMWVDAGEPAPVDFCQSTAPFANDCGATR